MTEFWHAVEIFIYGFGVGYLWHPVWTISKKIYKEAKIAQKEW